MNNFRSSLEGRPVDPRTGPLMPAKKPSGAVGDELCSLRVHRDGPRLANHRDDDRHRLTGEQAKMVVGRKTHDVDLVNVSGGGAMIATDVHLDMFQKVSLILGECDGLDCAVLWIRDGRAGLEFVPETQIGAKRPDRDRVLLEVLQRNFSGIARVPEVPAPTRKEQQPATEEAHRRNQQRHPLIWTGAIHHDHDTTPVRLRNISPAGALLDADASFAQESEVLLDLGGAGQHFARVCWSHGDQVGIKFATPFDLTLLAKEKPSVADSGWVAPDYLRNGPNTHTAWSNVSLDELEGFLKR